MRTPLKPRLLIFVVVSILAIAGCTPSFQPRPLEEEEFLKRTQTQSEGNVRVTAAALSAAESEAVFGVALYKKGIQPIWLEIENKDDKPTWFLPVSVDPDYFSPLEVTYPYHRTFDKAYNDQIDRYFLEHSMGLFIPPGTTRSGFVFTNLHLGTKSFNVDLVGEDNEPNVFTFFIPVPGLRADHEDVDFDNLYSANEMVSYDEAGFREALKNMPCCTRNKKGTAQGDPLNLVVIGDLDDVYYAFIRAGWDETETIYRASLFKTIRSFLFGGRYRYSPISALYVFGRPQDVALQRARTSIHERNHLRLWLAPMRFEGKLVWIGQISRDIGVRFTWKTITTHKIDPDVDETRNFLIQDLWYSQGLKTFGYVKGVEAAPYSTPRGNLTGDPYFTDGLRAVFWVSGQPLAFSDVGWIDWEMPPER